MPPFPGIPYGPAPAWCFPLTEVCMDTLLLICLFHAFRSRRGGAVPFLLGGLAFGLILEYLEVLGHSYTYGHFGVMLGRVPLQIPFCIGAGWAIILYTSRLFSDALRLPLLAAAALDTLLALNIDLSMDVVAYRLHMWHWYWDGPGVNPLSAQWFGIPYGNFNGWATVVFCYSLFSRLFERLLARRPGAGAARFIAVALLALLCSQIVLFSTETFLYPFLHDRLGITSAIRLLIIVPLLLLLAVFGWSRRMRPRHPVPLVATWVPSWFHLFFIGCFFIFGFFRESRFMTAIACLNVVVGITVHLYPWRLYGGRAGASSVENTA